MTQKISSIQSLHNLTSPMKKVETGWIPDFSSRYFTADFPYGLAIIHAIAKLLNYNAVNVFETLQWYRSVTGDMSELNLNDYGIFTIADLCNIYSENARNCT